MDILHVALGVAAGIGGSLIAEKCVSYYRKHLRWEAKRMQIAAEALRKHRQAVADLLENPEADPEIREFAVGMSEAVTSWEASRELVAFLVDAAHGRDNLPANPKVDAILDRAFSIESVKSQLNSAVRHGMVAMTMQWHDTTRQIEALAELAADDPKEVARATGAIRIPLGGGLSGMRPAFVPA